ncbi:MAG: PAS domain S-box protein [Gemmataceae bacterium]
MIDADDTLPDVSVSQLLVTSETFQQLPHPALAFDRAGRLALWNKAVIAFHGLNPDTVGGLDVCQLFPPEAADRLAAAVVHARESGWQGVLPVLASGNEVRMAEVRMAVIGEQVVARYRDVTDRERVRWNRRSARRWVILQDLAAAVVDELSSPRPVWAVQVRRLLTGAAVAFDSVIDQGAGRTVLVAGFHSPEQKVVAAFLDRCQYRTLVVDHAEEAAGLLDDHRGVVRAVVLGPLARPFVLSDLRADHPNLPAVLVGWERGAGRLPYPVAAARLVRGVAVAVGAGEMDLAACDECDEAADFSDS